MIKKCIICGKDFSIHKSRANTAKYCSMNCYSDGSKKIMQGSNHNCWKGGKHKNKVSGYISVYCPDHPNANHNRVVEHRLVMEKHLGRFLVKGEVVHHIDGIRHNNNISNLILMNNSSHARFHQINTKWAKKYDFCVSCKTSKYPHYARGYCTKCYSLNRKKFTYSNLDNTEQL